MAWILGTFATGGSLAHAEALRLTLAECVSLGVARNLQLASRGLERDQAQLDPGIQRRIFIPRLSTQASRQLDRGHNLVYEAAVTARGRDGLDYRVRAAGEQALDRRSRSSNTVTFSISRPLLRNFGHRVFGRAVDLARVDAAIASQVFVGQVNALILLIAEAYFDLLFARRNLEIQEQAVKRAVTQFEDTRHDIERGVLAGQEIYLVEENVVRFQVKSQGARRDITQAEMAMGALINFPVEAHVEILPSEKMREDLAGLHAYKDSRERLLQNNPEYRIRRLSRDRSLIDEEFFRNQILPLLDVFADHAITNGISSATTEDTSLGFRFEIPLSRAPERAASRKASLQVRSDTISIEDRSVQLSYQLKQLFVDLENQARILRLRGEATQLSRKKLDAEVAKYKNGIAPLVDVVRFQQELENSMIDETQALVRLNRLLIRRGGLEGTIYKDFGIAIRSLP